MHARPHFGHGISAHTRSHHVGGAVPHDGNAGGDGIGGAKRTGGARQVPTTEAGHGAAHIGRPIPHATPGATDVRPKAALPATLVQTVQSHMSAATASVDDDDVAGAKRTGG